MGNVYDHFFSQKAKASYGVHPNNIAAKKKNKKQQQLETKVVPLQEIRYLKISLFCVACEAWSAQRDKSPSPLSSALSHFWFPINNLRIVALISFKLYRRVKHHKLQVKFSSGGHPQNFD